MPVTALVGHQYMAGAYANENKERAELSVYRNIDGVTSFEGYLSGLLATAPKGDKLPGFLLGQLGQQVEVAISKLEALEGRDGVRDRSRITTLGTVNSSFQDSVAEMVSLLGQPDQLTAYYHSSLVPSFARLSELVRSSIASQSHDASQSAADASLSGWLGYGIGTVLIAIVLLRFAFVQRRVGHRKANIELDAVRHEFQTIVDQSGVAIFVCDLDGHYVLANRAFDELLGLDPGGAVGKRREEVVPAKLVGPMAAADRRVAAGETDVDERVYLVRREERLLSTFKFPLARPDGEIYGICGIVTDVTDLRQMEVQIERLADHDPLTGLYNRRRLMGELERHLEHARRHARSSAVLLLDIDKFKLLNDVYGHTTGDQQLVSVAHVLGERVREADTLARLGSDEFAVVLVDVSEQQAVTIATQIQALLSERPTGPPIATSIGITIFDGTNDLTPDDVLVAADIALYEAKEAGGGRATVYRGQSTAALGWVQRIRAALDQGRFVLYGQPIIDLRADRVSHHELLIRMLSDDGDIIPPAAFIPTAERFGLISEIDRWVTERALEFALAGTPVAINLSAHSMSDPAIVGAVRDAIKQGLDPSKLMFEITETAMMRNIAEARLLAGALTGVGCDLALDDFGTGFGSFTYLKHFPAKFLKIDMEFVRQISKDPTDQQIVNSIAEIAHALSKHTIAEGVEDEQTLEVLRAQDVDYAQGYLLGHPAPMPDRVHPESLETPDPAARPDATAGVSQSHNGHRNGKVREPADSQLQTGQ